MRFRTEPRTRMVARTIDGTTHEVPEEYSVRVPVAPADWDARAIRAASVVVLTLTVIAVCWSTVSIGALLRGGIGYAAAGLFDLSWIVAILLEWLSRFDRRKRRRARLLSWGLLAVTMGAILWHGLTLGDTALAVVGATVSLIAKVLWLGVMGFIDRELSPADAQWVAAEISQANARAAVAGARRAAVRMESAAAGELLAIQYQQREYSDALRAAGIAAPAPDAPAAVPASASVPAFLPTPAAPAAGADTAAPAAAGEDTDLPAPAGASPLESKQASPLADGGAVRPDTDGQATGARPEHDRVPAQRPRSMAGHVHDLMHLGITDARVITEAVQHATGRPVEISSVKREMRRQKATMQQATEQAHGDDSNGGYI